MRILAIAAICTFRITMKKLARKFTWKEVKKNKKAEKKYIDRMDFYTRKFASNSMTFVMRHVAFKDIDIDVIDR